MVKLILIATLIAYVSATENCDTKGILLYEDLGCTAINDVQGTTCPTSFDCHHFHRSNQHCHLHGTKYNIGDVIPNDVTSASCNIGCFCSGQQEDNKAGIVCAVLDCPDFGRTPINQCLKKYQLGQCCMTGEICPPFDNLATCQVNGKTYREGERFYPEDSCTVCVCQKGFTGQYVAPFCQRRTCGVELRQSKNLENHCAPVYRKDNILCCPSTWICSNGNEVIQTTTSNASQTKTCKYGDKAMNFGDQFVRTLSDRGQVGSVTCKCQIPPLLTCIYN